MRRSRDSLWVVGLLALVALGAATFRLRSGVDGERSPQVQASKGASPAGPVTLAKRSGDPRCCAALLCDLARALPPSVYLAGLQAEPDQGTVKLACTATREGRSIDLDLVGTTINQLRGLDCFGDASLYSGAPLVTPMPMGAFELSAAYRYDESASLASSQAFSGRGMSLERNMFLPVGSGPPPRQVLVLSDTDRHDVSQCTSPRWCFLFHCEAWVAELANSHHDCEILSTSPERRPGYFRLNLDSSLESLTSLLLTVGSRFEATVSVQQFRVKTTGTTGGKGRSPRLRVGLDIAITPGPASHPGPHIPISP